MEEAKKAAVKKGEVATDGKKLIRIEAFDKVDLKVAKITAADHVKGADKLLKFHMDDGTPDGRQILSGIAQWYPDPSVLVGKKVVIVANLKPRKMRGEVSQGMLLSVEKDNQVTVVAIDDALEPGLELG
jgi:methionyl-tRNA synthetase